jgi:hypothetical protein
VKKGRLALLLGFLAAGAYAESLWVYGANFQKSVAGDEMTFTVTVEESGVYQAALEVQGVQAQSYTVQLALASETGEPAVTTCFSFAGLDCG